MLGALVASLPIASSRCNAGRPPRDGEIVLGISNQVPVFGAERTRNAIFAEYANNSASKI